MFSTFSFKTHDEGTKCQWDDDMKTGIHLYLLKINFVQLILYLVSILNLHGCLCMYAQACISLRVQIPSTGQNVLFIISHYGPNKYKLKTWRSFHVYMIRLYIELCNCSWNWSSAVNIDKSQYDMHLSSRPYLKTSVLISLIF